MDYSERLKYFNSTDKYRRELKFLLSMINRGYGRILDYGCGIGTAIHYIQDSEKEHGVSCDIKGYDIQTYFNTRPYWMIDEVTGLFDNIMFIHSIAHIANINEVLRSLNDNLVGGGKITVITPNKDWINLVGDTKSDQTVIEHFTSGSLNALFSQCGYKVIKQGQFGDLTGNQHERLFIQVEK